ncbi:uncharacterized protein MYCGRDRAFT_98019 [Zymoseptoria tritici IPO323]|uniref:Uncharacterized protein n=1 Tax=Zymoseptoria tritici (strain CBS 115943 / IPO323) TaxID=336722 RepID=F9XS30_ZYMTI|nr:uncharacterized protein MYCGRDRAFT_98019 [Zymoseptoria tritici IPO323]EGP81897.1 hypothetical protein MYCGRDRAFT_98019 [Zymoseptoria tritici IPO323]
MCRLERKLGPPVRSTACAFGPRPVGREVRRRCVAFDPFISSRQLVPELPMYMPKRPSGQLSAATNETSGSTFYHIILDADDDITPAKKQPIRWRRQGPEGVAMLSRILEPQVLAPLREPRDSPCCQTRSLSSSEENSRRASKCKAIVVKSHLSGDIPSHFRCCGFSISSSVWLVVDLITSRFRKSKSREERERDRPRFLPAHVRVQETYERAVDCCVQWWRTWWRTWWRDDMRGSDEGFDCISDSDSVLRKVTLKEHNTWHHP